MSEYVFGVLLVAVAIGALLCFIIGDIIATVKYLKADSCVGEILEDLGEEKFSYYGRHYKKYEKYRVKFSDGQGIYEDTLLKKEKGLSIGTKIEVRYEIGKDGVHLLSDAKMRRLGNLLIVGALGVALAIYCINNV